jgi:hypothetical protein
MAAAGSSETSVSTYKFILCYSPDDHNVNSLSRENPKFQLYIYVYVLGEKTFS